MMEVLQRAQLLLQQGRVDMAEQEARRLLAEEPDCAEGHVLLALCLVQRHALEEATREAELAIHLEPESAGAHRVHAVVLAERKRFPEAIAAIEEARRLDPTAVFAHSLAAGIYLQQQKWHEALAAADLGLVFDPEDGDCHNFRAMALEKLGRLDEAAEAAAAHLTHAPDDDDAHATQGWIHLASGNHQEARESFREALRLDPGNESAKQGMLNALKAQNVVFRVFLWYFVTMSRLGSGAQWAIVLGLYFGNRVLQTAANANPELKPFALPILGAYFAFALLTWTINPLFNTFLRFNPYGRYLLTREQIWASNVTAGLIALGVVASLGFGLLDPMYGFFWFAYAILLLLPVSGTFAAPAGWPRHVMLAVTAGLAAIGLWVLLAPLLTGGFPTVLLQVFFLGVLGSQFLAMALQNQVVRK